MPQDFKSIQVAIWPRRLGGILNLPREANGLIIFAHGSGSWGFGPRNGLVAEKLVGRAFETPLFDLPSDQEARPLIDHAGKAPERPAGRGRQE